MKVILLDNVKKIGKKGELVVVTDGLALNKLIPQKKAIIATSQALVQLEKSKKIQQSMQVQAGTVYRKIDSIIASHTLVLSKKADPSGHLFEKIHPREVIFAIQQLLPLNLKSNISESDIEIPAIKSIGKHQIMYVPTKHTLILEIKPLG